MSSPADHFIRWFDDIRIQDIPAVGGKNASLGELRRGLTASGINVPNGFAVTVDAYRAFLDSNDLTDRIRGLLVGLDTRNVEDLQQRGRKIRQAILLGTLPAPVEEAILKAYDRLGAGASEPVDVAVRSSA